MGNKTRKIQEAEQRKKKQRLYMIIGGAAALSAIIIITVIILVQSNKTAYQYNPVSTAAHNVRLSPDSNGDLRVPYESLEPGITYISYGGHEEIIVLQNFYGQYMTAFDTCEECYIRGNVHFTLRGNTLICNACGTWQDVAVLGTPEWGGCKPVSIIPAFREDTDTELVFPAELLSYARDMFSHWSVYDFGVTLDVYGTEHAHVH